MKTKKTYGLETKVGKIILIQTFDSYDAAKKWGDKNCYGRGAYNVVELEAELNKEKK